jgi:hypothetical protein
MFIHFNEILFDKHIKIQFMCRMFEFSVKIIMANRGAYFLFLISFSRKLFEMKSCYKIRIQD